MSDPRSAAEPPFWYWVVVGLCAAWFAYEAYGSVGDLRGDPSVSMLRTAQRLLLLAGELAGLAAAIGLSMRRRWAVNAAYAAMVMVVVALAWNVAGIASNEMIDDAINNSGPNPGKGFLLIFIGAMAAFKAAFAVAVAAAAHWAKRHNLLG